MALSGVSTAALLRGCVLLTLVTLGRGAARCVCMLDGDGAFLSFDLLKFALPLPCTYRMARMRTHTGCDMMVNLVMSQNDDDIVPVGMTYLVNDGGRLASGQVSERGVGVSDPQGFDTVFYPPSVLSLNGVETFPYTDRLGFRSALFPACAVSLHFQPRGYLGVFPRNASDSFLFSRDYLCGDCDGGKAEMRMLGGDVLRKMKTWDDRTAAMLYYSALHVVGGDEQCSQHAALVRRCPANVAFRAAQVCGAVLPAASRTGRCMRKRTTSRDRTDLYYACVRQYCGVGGNSLAGCNMVHRMVQRNSCPLPDKFSC